MLKRVAKAALFIGREKSRAKNLFGLTDNSTVATLATT